MYFAHPACSLPQVECYLLTVTFNFILCACGVGPHLNGSLLYPHCLAPCLAQSRSSIHIFWENEWINPYEILHPLLLRAASYIWMASGNMYIVCVCVCLCELCPILAKLCCSILRLSDTRFQGLAFVPSIPLCQVNYLLIHMEPDWDHFYQVANNTDSREEKKVAWEGRNLPKPYI